jgi:hypothetical protein
MGNSLSSDGAETTQLDKTIKDILRNDLSITINGHTYDKVTIKRACCLGLAHDKMPVTVMVPDVDSHGKLISVPVGVSVSDSSCGDYAHDDLHDSSPHCDQFYQDYCNHVYTNNKASGKTGGDLYYSPPYDCNCLNSEWMRADGIDPKFRRPKALDLNCYGGKFPPGSDDPETIFTYMPSGMANENPQIVQCVQSIKFDKISAGKGISTKINQLKQNCGDRFGAKSQSTTTDPTVPTTPATDQSTTDPTTNQSTTDPTTDQSTTDPTTDQSTTDPTTDQSTTDPTTDQSTTDPTNITNNTTNNTTMSSGQMGLFSGVFSSAICFLCCILIIVMMSEKR